MADERQLNVTTRLDATGLRAGMDEAATVVQQGAATMQASFATAAEASAALAAAQTEMAAVLKAVGGTIDESNAAWGIYSAAAQQAAAAGAALSQAQAAVAAETESAAASATAAKAAMFELAASQDSTAASSRAMDSAMASGTARIGASAAGLGGLGFALGRVGAQSALLGPLLADVFPILAAGALVDIVVQLADEFSKWYKNTFLLKQELTDLRALVGDISAQANATNWDAITAAAGAMRAGGDAMGALNETASNIGKKPVTLHVKIAQADLDRINQLVPGLRSFINELQRPDLTLAQAEQHLSKIQPLMNEIFSARQLGFISHEQVQSLDLANEALHDAYVTIQNIQSATGSGVATQLETVLNKQAEEAKKNADAVERGQEQIARAVEAGAKEQERVLAEASAQHTKFVGDDITEATRGANREAEAVIEGLNEQSRAAKRIYADEKGARNEQLQQDARNIEANAQLAIAAIEQQARAHQITGQQELAATEAIYQKEHDALVALLNEELAALDSSDANYLTEKQRLNNEIQQADNRLAKQQQQAQGVLANSANAAAKSWSAHWTSAIGMLSTDFEHVFESVLTEHATFSQAMARAADQMASQMIASIMRASLAYALGSAIQQTAAQKQILVDAKTAAANTYNAVSSIPIVGPFLAPPAAAAAFAEVEAFGSFDQGGIVPNTGFHFLHAQEMVLPTNIATAVTQMAGGGSPAGGGDGDANLNATFNINANDSKSFAAMLQGPEVKRALVQLMQQAYRERAFG